MADKSSKNPNNVNGEWYVDDTCTSCGLCTQEAPEIFVFDDDEMAYVQKQPETPEEISNAESAMESCPVEAIGNNG